MYKVASASEYLVITGWGIPDIKLAKKSWVFPGQSCSVFDLSPVNYSFEVQAMSAEKLPFILPAVFTIGPRVDDEDALFKYAKLISSHDKHSNHTNELVQGIIEGETRVLAASMTMEEIFKGTKEFKQEVSGKVQLELNQFGLLIHNTNMKQLVDVRGHEYVCYLGQKTQMEAANQAKIDELQTEVEVESVKAVNLREAELQMEVERMNASTRTEKRRDEFLRKTSVEYVTKSATTTKYRVASVSEYLVITGLGSPDVKLSKKSWVFPGQSCTVFDVSLVNYTFEVQAMSTDKLPFILPAVFTIGPRVDDEEALFKYAKHISSHDKHSNHTNELVQGIIERETRVLAASMTMEAILKGTKEFKQVVFGKVQLELNQFGLLIYNANVKQLVDVRGHEYVSYLSQKTQMEAANKVKIDVAEARTKGEIGSKVRDTCCIVKSLHDIYVVFVDMVDCISN